MWGEGSWEGGEGRVLALIWHYPNKRSQLCPLIPTIKLSQLGMIPQKWGEGDGRERGARGEYEGEGNLAVFLFWLWYLYGFFSIFEHFNLFKNH